MRCSKESFLALALTLTFMPSCVREQHTPGRRRFSVEDPRSTGGIVLEDPRDPSLQRFVAALEREHLPRNDHEPRSHALPRAASYALHEPPTETVRKPQATMPSWPRGSGKVLPLAELSSLQRAELLTALALFLQVEEGYHEVERTSLADDLPALPKSVMDTRFFLREDETKDERHVLCLGLTAFHSQATRLCLYGVSRQGEGTALDPNADLEHIETAARGLITETRERTARFAIADLERDLLELGYIDREGALAALEGLGVHVVRDLGTLKGNIERERLPLVLALPGPPADSMGLVGDRNTQTGEFGLSTSPTVASQLSTELVASPANTLLILSAPTDLESRTRVLRLIEEVVDRPSRQIFVEGMVLELSADSLLDLGVEYATQRGRGSYAIGSLAAGGIQDTLDGSFLDSRDLPRDFSVRVRALVRSGRAEILSRPSVITLDNRQATIRVGEDIPIATSQEGALSSDKISFNFKYLATGILLNIKPRMNSDGSEVSMLIDTIVSAVVPGRDLEIRDREGGLLATAPTVSTRRVQTYARIENQTPFIIGGLVSRDEIQVQDKVPLLGDVPLLGPLFRAERTETRKREVIIVLTPYVLRRGGPLARNIPRDEERFDDFGNELFRDGYRIRTSDVFEVSFLYDTERFLTAQKNADAILARRRDLQTDPALAPFAHGARPGEEPLVHRMVYEVVKRTGIDEALDPDRLIFLSADQMAAYEVQFLTRVLARLAEHDGEEAFFENGRALVLRFHSDAEANRAGQKAPAVEVLPCADRDAWRTLLWRENRNPGTRALVIAGPEDLIRLRRAVLVKEILEANEDTSNAVDFRSFRPGTNLQVPKVSKDGAYVIDTEVARLFYHTEHYYGAATDEIQAALETLEQQIETTWHSLLRREQ